MRLRFCVRGKRAGSRKGFMNGDRNTYHYRGADDYEERYRGASDNEGRYREERQGSYGRGAQRDGARRGEARRSGAQRSGAQRDSYSRSGQRSTAQRDANGRSGQGGGAQRDAYRRGVRSDRSQQGATQRGAAQRDRAANRYSAAQRGDSRARNAQRDLVHYRQAERVAIRQRRFWGAYIAIAAAVAIATVFGFAVSFGGTFGAPGGAHHVATTETSESGNGEQAAPEQGGEGEPSQAASATPANLGQRETDFAVDPARTDWNYEPNDHKTVYLTIDDGPSEKTQAVLDILDKYGCKATFFVVGHNEEYFPMIAEAFKRGHTIGMHTYSHDYAEVYSSVDAYFADLDAIAEVVKNQIGFVPCFIRFPGGSSNEISASYCAGIMSELVDDVQKRGYQYYDWNLSVGDGSEHTTEEIIGYGTADEGSENIMLLCHDSATKQTTVDALPSIIEHYQSLGYTFEAIDRNSWVCHHGVNN